jgi:hypothetical protein
MTRERAIRKAHDRAQAVGTYFYVVFEPEEGFEICTIEELDTYYAGAEPVYCAGPE